MTLDMSYGTKIRTLTEQRKLLKYEMSMPEQNLFPEWISIPLSFLSPSQLIDAHLYFIKLQDIVAKNPIYEFAFPGEWFDRLQPAQQTRVIEFYNIQLFDDYGLVLTEYGKKGLRSDFRFEIPYPVASR